MTLRLKESLEGLTGLRCYTHSYDLLQQRTELESAKEKRRMRTSPGETSILSSGVTWGSG